MSEPIVGYTKSSGLVEVDRVFYNPAKEGKKSFVRVPVRYREFAGQRNGVPNYQLRYATLLAWSEIADAMQSLKAGDRVVFEGAYPNASRPYQNQKGEYSSVPEHKVQSWYCLTGGDAPEPPAVPIGAIAEAATKAAFAASAAAHDAAGKLTPAAAGFGEEEFVDPFAEE